MTLKFSIVGLVSIGCITAALAASNSTSAPDASAITVTPEQIATEPGQYIGKTVLLQKSAVDKVYSPQIFTVRQDRLLARREVPVIIPKLKGTDTVKEKEAVEVKGQVREFVYSELHEEYDGFRAAADVQVKLKGIPVIVAESVRTKAGTELVDMAAVSSGKRPASQPAASEAPAPRSQAH
jgi:hypothetical protein